MANTRCHLPQFLSTWLYNATHYAEKLLASCYNSSIWYHSKKIRKLEAVWPDKIVICSQDLSQKSWGQKIGLQTGIKEIHVCTRTEINPWETTIKQRIDTFKATQNLASSIPLEDDCVRVHHPMTSWYQCSEYSHLLWKHTGFQEPNIQWHEANWSHPSSVKWHREISPDLSGIGIKGDPQRVLNIQASPRSWCRPNPREIPTPYNMKYNIKLTSVDSAEAICFSQCPRRRCRLSHQYNTGIRILAQDA